MKHLLLYAIAIFSFCSCGHGHGHGPAIDLEGFVSEKISNTVTITLNGDIESVFPLFNPIEEQKWAPVFKPSFLYPSDEVVQEGMSFKTAGRGDEAEYLWIITKYDQLNHLIQYLVSTENRYWTITVDNTISPTDASKTIAQISYSFYSLNSKGKDINDKNLDRMFANDLEDWEEAINSYLAR